MDTLVKRINWEIIHKGCSTSDIAFQKMENLQYKHPRRPVYHKV